MLYDCGWLCYLGWPCLIFCMIVFGHVLCVVFAIRCDVVRLCWSCPMTLYDCDWQCYCVWPWLFSRDVICLCLALVCVSPFVRRCCMIVFWPFYMYSFDCGRALSCVWPCSDMLYGCVWQLVCVGFAM